MAVLAEDPLLPPLAPEAEDIGEEIRQTFFRTRAGRTYRALFLIVGDEVRVLRIRGAGQAPVTSEDLGDQISWGEIARLPTLLQGFPDLHQMSFLFVIQPQHAGIGHSVDITSADLSEPPAFL